MTVVTQARIDAYAHVSGDMNPLHVDPVFAASTPFGRTIAHGQLLLGLIALEASRRWPEQWPTSGRIDVKFIGPVFAGDDVSITLADDGSVELRVADRLCVVGTARIDDILEAHRG